MHLAMTTVLLPQSPAHDELGVSRANSQFEPRLCNKAQQDVKGPRQMTSELILV